jgi:hypothetical protein
MWVDEGKLLRVQHEADIRPAVQAVTDDGNAKSDEGMHAQLMRTTGLGPHCDTGATALAGQDPPLGDSGFSMDRVDDLARPVIEVDAER